MISSAQTSSLQKVKNDAVSASIAARALLLFDERGFDGVTVDDIAAAAGISRRSFFRYFPTKEDVVVGTHAANGPKVTDALTARPEGENVWLSLRRAFDFLADNVTSDPDMSARTMRVINSTASLRAHSLEKHLAWAVDLVPEITRRLGGKSDQLAASALIHAAFGCLDVALAEFAINPDDSSIHELLDAAFEAITAQSGR